MDADDIARKEFLETLAEALDTRWSATYAEVKPHRVLGMTLRCEGVEGFATVVPSVIDGTLISWRSFPGSGRPHFDLSMQGSEHVRTCVKAHAVTVLERWATSRQPVQRSAATEMLTSQRPILAALAAAPEATVEDAIDALAWDLTPEGESALADVRAVVDPARIARAFPRADDGRLRLETEVLLAALDSTKRRASGRGVYVIARGPRVRRDGDRITLVLGDAIEANETHRWLEAPWSWKTGVKAPPIDARMGECAARLDEGAFDEALAMYGITMSESVVKVLEGVPLGGGSNHMDEWQAVLRRTLWAMAPWQLVGTPRGRIALFPHQRHQRKLWLTWHPPSTLDIENTGSNARMAEISWARPRAFDLERLGVPVASRKTRAKPARLDASGGETPSAPAKSLAELIAGKRRWKATTALAQAKRRPQGEAVSELLAIVRGSGTSDERANAVWILGELDVPDIARTLMPCLHDRDTNVQSIAVTVVKSAGYVEAVPVLAGLVIESRAGKVDAGLGVHAATAMKTLSGTRGPAGLVPYFAHEDPRVREAACHAVAFYSEGHKLVRPHVEARLLDEDPRVREVARVALGKLRLTP